MKLFISYARQDQAVKTRLIRNLDHLRQVGLEFLHDDIIDPGADWHHCLEKALREASAALLLVSPAFLASDFCQGNEVPRLLQRGIPLVPVLLETTDWEAHDWLGKLQIFRPFGQLLSLQEIEAAGRDAEFYRRLSRKLRELASRTRRPSRLLRTRQERQRFVDRLLAPCRPASDLDDDTLRALAQAFLELWAADLYDAALELAKHFKAVVEKHPLTVEDPVHQEVLDLLQIGLPVRPVHLYQFARIDLDTLFQPGYGRLMRAIRLTEVKDYGEALVHIQDLLKSRPNLANCAFLSYAQGQCRRKLGAVASALSCLRIGLDQVQAIPGEQCTCVPSPGCEKAALEAQILRGLGAVCRELADQRPPAEAQSYHDEAKRYFELSLQLGEGIHDEVKADIRYSYGYFILKRTFKAGSSSPGYGEQLQRAGELFGEARELATGSAAPIARLGLVRHLLGEDATSFFDVGRERARRDQGGEAALTAILCGFGLLFAARHRPEDGSLRSGSLFEELVELMDSRLLAKGPLECHAFDCQMIRREEPLEGGLLWTFELLQEAATWSSASLPEQQHKVREFCGLRAIEIPAPTANPCA